MDIYPWIAAFITFLAGMLLPLDWPLKFIVAVVLGVAVAQIIRIVHTRMRKDKAEDTPAMSPDESAAMAAAVLKALGGKDNVVKVDYCATRLRFEVRSYASVDEAAVKAAGAVNVIRPAKTACQVVIKGDVQSVYDALRKLL